MQSFKDCTGEERMLTEYWQKFEQKNVLAPRSYYIPCRSRTAAETLSREKSECFCSLNGKWEFRRYSSIYEAENFLEENTDTEIDVPSCVQYYGHEEFKYLSNWYEIPCTPPRVPNRNPVFLYRRQFEITSLANQFYLVCEGIASCFYLYINKKFVGFSQISHKQTEFDITGFVKEGTNTVDILVLKWCAGTFLENQDKWRLNGIFGEVYLLTRPYGHLNDFRIDTRVENNGKGIVAFSYEGNTPCEIRLLETGKRQSLTPGETAEFEVAEPKLWSAETPNLYHLLISCAGEWIVEEVGIRKVEIREGVLTLNDVPIKLYGVNRHDFEPGKGYCVNLEDMRRDLLMMKAYNVNAVRTSHYPNFPELYRLADRIGLYIMSEADYETQGTTSQYGGSDIGLYSEISDDPQYGQAIAERIQYLYEREKNRPSVIIWSLGNESGYGCNLENAAKWLKTKDSSRPLHYEGIFYSFGKDIYYQCAVDFASRMYPPLEWLTECYLADERETRPLILCEYCHAMGNGPGDLKDYWEILDSSPRFAGGFVWEWMDQAVENEEGRYRHGGDFPGFNSGSFCLDGLAGPAREFKPGLAELKVAYQPLHFQYTGKKVKVRSKYSFRTFEGIVKLSVKSAGKLLAQREYSLHLSPQNTSELEVPAWKNDGEEYTAIYLTAWENDRMIAQADFPLFFGNPYRTKSNPAGLIQKEGNRAKISCGQNVYRIDLSDGSVISVECDGHELLKAPLTANLWRAPIDNDVFVQKDWETAGIRAAHTEIFGYDIEETHIRLKGWFVSEFRAPLADIEWEYAFYEDGSVTVSLSYRLRDFVKSIPRIGFCTKLEKVFDRVTYLGCGPLESYCDKHLACPKDLYTYRVREQPSYYVRPQETGSRYNVDRMSLAAEDYDIEIRSEGKGFSFSALKHSAEELSDCGHSDLLPEQEFTNLSVDYAMRGTGSDACGPVLSDKYAVPREGSFAINIQVKKRREA